MKVLFICNTSYQIIVASWIKYKYYNNCDCDLIISDHMNGYEALKYNAEKVGLFENVYSVKSKTIVYKRDLKNFFKRMILYRIFPNFAIKRIGIDKNYDVLFISNYDFFNAAIFDALKRENHNLELNVFEDGIATYGLITKEFYNCFKPSKYFTLRFLDNYVLKRNTFYNNVNSMMVFEPDLCEWNPNCRIDRIDKLNPDDEVFKNTVNTIFDYYNIEDNYEEKYIFFEESFFADTGWNADIRLLEQIADIVGKENLLIKIHPRNPVNRFMELGYKTNKNTSVPWEVIALNININNYTLITISSTSVISPAKCFNKSGKAFSLINCLENKPTLLSGNYLNTVKKFFSYYNINMTNNIYEIFNN